MEHVGALPGTAASRETPRELKARAVAECAVYREAGVHGVDGPPRIRDQISRMALS